MIDEHPDPAADANQADSTSPHARPADASPGGVGRSSNSGKAPLHIGVTGGIGSGKSMVCRLFSVLGVPVYHADERAKALMEEDPALIAGITARFGEVYDAQGRLRRKALADQVFHNPEALAELNALVHPAVFRDASSWSAGMHQHPYVLREAALLYESGSWKHVDEVLMVWAPEALRLERVMQRDGLTEAEVRARMDRQMPVDEKRQRADRVIVNDGSQSLVQQVWSLHREWMDRVASDQG
jgi:dephospho-CoA kinase